MSVSEKRKMPLKNFVTSGGYSEKQHSTGRYEKAENNIQETKLRCFSIL